MPSPAAADTREDASPNPMSGNQDTPQDPFIPQHKQLLQSKFEAGSPCREQTQGPHQQPDTGAASTAAEPSLASRSAPIAAAASQIASNASCPLPPTPIAPVHGSSFHLGVSAFLTSRSPGLSAAAELSRRLRGLLTTAVNFRDVELMPQPQPLEGEMGLMEQTDEADADAATGSAAAAPPLPSPRTSATAVDRAGSAGSVGSFGGSVGVGGASDGGGGEGEGSALAGAASGGAAAAAAGLAAGGVRHRVGGAVVRKNKLVIIMVGLPGRGKTFLCNKLCCYLNWLGHATRHFNVGQYRRRQKPADELQDASFFDHCNEAGVEARNRALNAALDDLMAWLRSDAGQVAVFDATNTTEGRRNHLRSKFHGVWQYLFIETMCSDPAVLEQNYRNKMQYSPDYQGVDTDRAVSDFLARIAKYEEVYEPIEDRNLHYIKLIDMVTGRGHMDINRISGYLPGKIVFFLMQVCKAGLTSARRIWLTRHGESQYNQKGLIGGDSSLSERGERYAQELPAALVARLPQDQTVSVAVWTSTLKRTIQTARSLPFPKLRWKALDEINAGICDGMTYEDIAERFPHEYEARKKDTLRYRYPAGESYMDVIQRVEPVIIELERERECVVVVAHQAVLRAVYAYFMNVPPEDIPRLSIPLHTLIELTPMPDGTMSETRFPVDISGVVAAAGGNSSSGPGAPSPLLRSPSGASGVELAAALAAAEAAAAAAKGGAAAEAGVSPLSSVNSGVVGACRQDSGGASLLVPASPAADADEAASAPPPAGVAGAEGVVRPAVDGTVGAGAHAVAVGL